MIYIKNILLGAGMSSFVYFNIKKGKPKVLTGDQKKILKSKNFYEFEGLGGNSNIWGGYINFSRHKRFLKNRNYKKLFEKRLFKIQNIFSENSHFSNTCNLVDKNDNIFRIKKENFKNKALLNKVRKINIKKNKIELVSDKEIYSTETLTLCIGNLNLIKLLYNSEIIDSRDIISFEDGNCTYVPNLLIDKKKNYYIPMPLLYIFEKLFRRKSKNYRSVKSSLILQKFSSKTKNIEISCKELMKMKSYKLRFFLSNHIANLRINNEPVRKFISKKSKKINIFCSGTVNKYIPGPIIQDLIFDIATNN